MSDELSKRVAQLQAAFASGILDEDTFRAALAGLGQPAGTQGEVQGSGGLAQGVGSTALGERAAQARDVYGDLITGNVYHGPPTQDPKEALQIYRRVIMTSSGGLPLLGVDKGASEPGKRPLNLAQVYVGLDTTTLVAAEKEPDGKREMERDKQRPLSALEAVINQQRLVLLGDPGGGKSTFVNHLAHCLAAHGAEPESGWLTHLPGWPQTHAQLLPLLVVLRDFAANLPDPLPRHALARHLWEFVVARLADQNLGFVAEPLQTELEAGEVLLLLDGLDEVPTVDQRRFVRDAVHAFQQRYGRSRLLVTCRILSYQPPEEAATPDLRLAAHLFPSFELAPFDAAKRESFVGGWYAELQRLGTVAAERAEQLAERLQQAVQRPDLGQLAENPLLLTVMALVHTHKGDLPDARALLYEETVDMLLWRWEQVKTGAAEQQLPLRQLLLAAERADVDLKRVLGELAYRVHGQGAQGKRQVAYIDEATLYKTVAQLNGNDWGWGQQLVGVMKLRAGLLVEDRPGLFAFPHRTFQEYLAGTHLADQPDFARQGARLAAEGVIWREVILLAVGHLVYQRRDVSKPLLLVGELCPAMAVEMATGWLQVWLAGEVLLEMGLRRVQDEGLGRELLARVQQRLARLVAGGELTARERAEAGRVLARLGDPRPGVGVRQVGGMAIPDLTLCWVPPGPFWLGSGAEDEEAADREKPLHQVDIPYGYWLGQYSVTVAQWQAFVAASGHRPVDADSLRGVGNEPVVYVTWHEAVAFCGWLTTAWRQAGWLPAGGEVRLPSEAEWEKGARGGVAIAATPLICLASNLAEPTAAAVSANLLPQRRFPWGEERTQEAANGETSGVGTTTAVGGFPAGASPYGALDMSGNVWEWTRSLWGQDWQKPDFGYPYHPDDGREEMTKGNEWLRVVRGGSFYNQQAALRCASRGWGGPPDRILHHRISDCGVPIYQTYLCSLNLWPLNL